MALKTFNFRFLLVKILFYVLLLTLFFQTRYAFFARHQVVDYLIPFVYLSDVLIVLLLVGSLKSLSPLKSRKLIFQSVSLSVFLLSAAISNLSTIHSVSAWYHWFKLLEFGAFTFWIAYFIKAKSINNPPAEVRHWRTKAGQQLTIINLLSLGLVFECLIAIGEFVLQRSLGLQILGEWRFSVLTPGIAKVILFGKEFLRPYATFPHPNVLGGILAIMAPVNLHLAFTRKFEVRNSKFQTNSKHEILNRFLTSRSLLTIYYLLFTLTLFLTFSRSAWLAYGVLMVVVLGFWGWRVRGFRELTRRTTPVLLFALCSLLFVVPFVHQRIKSLQTIDILSIERRVELNRAAIAMFRDHPLFGVGLGNFVPNLEKYLVVSGQGRFLQPVHNVPLLILTETGFVGFTAFFLFLVGLLYNFLRSGKFSIFPSTSLRAGNFQFSILLMWMGILITSLFDHYFWTLQAGQLFFWLTIGLTISSLQNPKTSEEL